MERNEVEEKYRWNAEEIYPSYEAWQKEKEETEKKYVDFDYSGNYKKRF